MGLSRLYLDKIIILLINMKNSHYLLNIKKGKYEIFMSKAQKKK